MATEILGGTYKLFRWPSGDRITELNIAGTATRAGTASEGIIVVSDEEVAALIAELERVRRETEAMQAKLKRAKREKEIQKREYEAEIERLQYEAELEGLQPDRMGICGSFVSGRKRKKG